jgi:hypothetical protein
MTSLKLAGAYWSVWCSLKRATQTFTLVQTNMKRARTVKLQRVHSPTLTRAYYLLPYLYHQDYELLIYVCLFVVFLRALTKYQHNHQPHYIFRPRTNILYTNPQHLLSLLNHNLYHIPVHLTSLIYIIMDSYSTYV